MQLQRFDVRLRLDRVQELKKLALRISNERGVPVTWVSLLRTGMDLVLKAEGGDAAAGLYSVA